MSAGSVNSLKSVEMPTGESATYYIQIMSLDNAALSFGVVESLADSAAGYLSKELKAGLGQTDTIESLEGGAYYTFEAQGDSLNTLYINLVPIHGKFRLTARNDGSKPTID